MTAIPPGDLEGQKPFRVRRGRVDSVDLYEIKDVELDTLERGSPADIQLNFAIFLLSLAFSALATLLTATFAAQIVQVVFVVVLVVGILMGWYLLVSWNRSRRSLRDLCAKIRNRIPPEVPTPVAPSAPSAPKDPNQPSG